MQSHLETAGDETVLKVYADKQSMKAGGQDLIYVSIELTFVGDWCEIYYRRALAVLRSNREAGEINVSERTKDRLEGKCSLKAEA